MQRALLCVLVIATLALARPALSQNGNGAPNGAHYNLNIIGVENPKTTTMTGGDRHTIFVGLGKKANATTSIYLTPGPFTVCDGNVFDPAYACTGSQIAQQGAVFQLPCNTSTPTET